MLNRVGWVRHAVIGGVVVVTSLTGALGVVGAGDQGLFRSEHFDAKHITLRPDDRNGVLVNEVVDIDFGTNERRGYQRIVPNDFGDVTDVVAESPDADDRVEVVVIGSDTRIRIGDPDVTFTGQHRYVLGYRLPLALADDDDLAIDVIGTEETFDSDRFEVTLAGFGIESADAISCDVGRREALGGCEFEEVGPDTYSTVIEPLEAGDGVTVYAPVGERQTVDLAPLPELPERRPAGFPLVGLMQLLAGALTAGGIYSWFRRKGSNDVFGAGGAADAAFAPVPSSLAGPSGPSFDLPIPAAGNRVADVATYRVSDNRLADLATIEFVPPGGIQPWQGNALLREKVDNKTVSAWFSEMVAREAIEISGSADSLTLRPGVSDARLSAVDRGHLATLFSASSFVDLGTYDKSFAAVWQSISAEQQRFIEDSGWWQQGNGSAGHEFTTPRFSGLAVVVALIAFVWGSISFGLLSTKVGAVALSVIVAAVTAGCAYVTMLASRTATGSALTLRTESFRRFLQASEGRHVDWAWEQGVIREYSAWAVALGAADAWSDAIESSNVDRPEQFTSPLMVYTFASSFSSSISAPASSGSGSGGFSGGGVGGGGGGGSSGSW